MHGSPPSIFYRKYTNEALEKLNNCFHNVKWHLVFSSEDLHVYFANFPTVLTVCFNLHFPLITIAYNHKDLSKYYITPDLIYMIKEKNKIQRKYSKRPVTYGALYRRLRNQVANTLREARTNYKINYQRIQECQKNLE